MSISKPLALSLIAQKASKSDVASLSANAAHTVLKVALRDSAVYASVAAINAAYAGQLSAAGAAIAFDNYPAAAGGPAVVELRQAGPMMTHTVIRAYHEGLTVVDNSQTSKQYTWTGSAWRLDTPEGGSGGGTTETWTTANFDAGASLDATKYRQETSSLGAWRIRRIVTTNGVAVGTTATVTNNPTTTSATVAWANRAALNYA